MNQPRRISYLSGYLVLLGLGYLWAGYLLAIYQVPLWIWFVTFATTLHLVWVGPGAIALSMVWALVLTWIAVLVDVHPVEFPWMYGKMWAFGLVTFWVRAIALVWLLGFGHRVLKSWRVKKTHSFWLLLGLVWSTLGMGAFLHIAQGGTPLFALFPFAYWID